jgi:hypothetical protein
MRSLGDWIKGGWWKFSQYEIRGRHICPARSATLEWYDPWDLYRKSTVSKGVPRPYEHLIRLRSSIPPVLDAVPLRKTPRDRAAEDKVIKWCSEFGLLGILPHTIQRIQSAPRFRVDQEGILPVYHEWTRVGGGWEDLHHLDFAFSPVGHPIPRALIEVLRRRPAPFDESVRIPKTHPAFRTPYASITASSAYEQGDVCAPPNPPAIATARLIQTYFPECADTELEPFDCPIPGTMEFCNLYSEPYDLFVYYAGRLCDAIQPFLERSKPRWVTCFEEYLQPLRMGLEEDSEGNLQETWSSPSLLCTFARMAYQDVTAGLTARSCECCHDLFVPDNPRARYCTQKCGFRQRKRRARSHKDAAGASLESQRTVLGLDCK